MKENKYDDDTFFEAYRKFPRSVEGLQAAGEWQQLQKLLPDFKGKRVLDIGCGFGWHCIYAAQNGASYVLGTDISQKMLDTAKQKAKHKNIEYRRVAMEDLDFASDSFDIVISSLALHYTPDFGAICRTVYNSLSRGGSFVFSVEHPIFTAQGTQDWSYDGNKQRVHWPVDNYFAEGERKALFLGETVTKYHKTLTTYVNTMLQTGFTLSAVVEPQPASHLLDTVPGMRDELRRPMMLIISGQT